VVHEVLGVDNAVLLRAVAQTKDSHRSGFAQLPDFHVDDGAVPDHGVQLMLEDDGRKAAAKFRRREEVAKKLQRLGYAEVDSRVMGVWEGVAMDFLKFHPAPPCPTLLCSAGEPPLKLPYGRLPPPWTPNAVNLYTHDHYKLLFHILKFN
jgi:hypothetical protein